MFCADVEGFIMKELKQHHEGAWNRQTSWCRGVGAPPFQALSQAPRADPRRFTRCWELCSAWAGA